MASNGFSAHEIARQAQRIHEQLSAYKTTADRILSDLEDIRNYSRAEDSSLSTSIDSAIELYRKLKLVMDKLFLQLTANMEVWSTRTLENEGDTSEDTYHVADNITELYNRD